MTRISHVIGFRDLAVRPAFLSLEKSESSFTFLRRVFTLVEYVLQKRVLCVGQGDNVYLSCGNPPVKAIPEQPHLDN